MNIGEFSEKDASDYAYLLMEAATWQEFETMLKLNGVTTEQGVKDMIDLIVQSVQVDTQKKISIK